MARRIKKSADALAAAYAKTWKGWRMDGAGFLVPDEKKSWRVELATKASTEAFALKAFDPEAKLYISGVANANEVDRMREVVDPQGGQFEAYLKNSVLLLQHDHRFPLGLVTSLEKKKTGTTFDGWVGDPKAGPMTRWQDDTRSLIAQRILKAVSIGFIPHKIRMPAYNEMGEVVEPATIELWEMLELSVVAVPCNAGALFDAKEHSEEEEEAADLVVAEAARAARVYFPAFGKGASFGKTTQTSDDAPLEAKEMEELLKLLKELGVTLGELKTGLGEIKEVQVAVLDVVKGKKPPMAEDDEEEEEDEEEKAKREAAEKKAKEDRDALDARLKAIEDTQAALKGQIETIDKTIGLIGQRLKDAKAA